MKLFQRYAIVGETTIEKLADVVSQAIYDLVQAINRISLGVPVDDNKVENLDACWLVADFGAANTDKVFGHRLGRTPVGLFQVEAPLITGESLLAGQVLFKSATSTTVTLQSTGANKKARVILF